MAFGGLWVYHHVCLGGIRHEMAIEELGSIAYGIASKKYVKHMMEE